MSALRALCRGRNQDGRRACQTVLARHGPAGDLVGQGVGRILAALPGLTVQAAELPALGRVDPVQAYPLAMDFERIAVDHRGDAGHVGQGRGDEQAQGDGEGSH